MFDIIANGELMGKRMLWKEFTFTKYVWLIENVSNVNVINDNIDAIVL